MKLIVTRDSVAAGDDVDAPHRRQLKLPDGASIEDAVMLVAAPGYLPKIAGGAATWSVVSRLPIAVVAQQWPQPRLLSPIPRDLGQLKHEGGALRVHVNYHAQQDPETVFEVLRRLSDGGF